MSDDWARNCISVYKERQQEKQNVQKRAVFSEAVARDVFQGIRERIRSDLRTLHDAGIFSNVYFGEEVGATGQFAVIAYDLVPGVSLVVQLNIVVIRYTYFFPATQGKPAEEKPGVLRITADLGDGAKIYRNGSAFADESEVSEFLLKPLLDYLVQ